VTNDPTTRTGWLADVRAVLGAIEACPQLALPYIRADQVEFFLLGTIGAGSGAPRILAETEGILATALGVTFTARKGDENVIGEERYYFLEAVLENGTPLRIKSWAAAVAERHVIGQRVVEDTEWVRLPVVQAEPDSAEDEDAELAEAGAA
jgi:hypothetical protein